MSPIEARHCRIEEGTVAGASTRSRLGPYGKRLALAGLGWALMAAGLLFGLSAPQVPFGPLLFIVGMELAFGRIVSSGA